ncbi:MAG TPA: aminopeptidase [Steroidobacteraceae bacterium]|jgi:predicted aminopeptidase|nr:aminopeptidase [Steroidobacteraceae bacterium]
MLTDRRSLTALKTRLLAIALIGATLPGCAIGYLTQAAQGQWRLMRARRPIEQVIADPASSEELKARLRVVQDARDFAVSDLGLPDNRSYRSYSDLKRPYVVWNVVAAPEFSVEPQRWCFPFTGCLSYRGYFRERDARRMADALAARGNDVMVGGVTAYSTLGHFADPVLNTMLRYGDLELVSTMFHELAHQLIYVRGDTVFNESFAVSVEQEGLRRWLAARGRSLELQDYLERRHAEQLIVDAFADGRRQLAALYALSPPLPVGERRARKRAILDATGAQVQAVERQLKLRTGYDKWIADGLNNAHLASIGTYFDCVPGFERLLAANGGSLPAFYAAVRNMRADAAARRALCRADGGAAQPAAPTAPDAAVPAASAPATTAPAH